MCAGHRTQLADGAARCGATPGPSVLSHAQRVSCLARAALPSAHGVRRLPRGFQCRTSVSVEGHARGATRCARDIERCRARHCTVWRHPGTERAFPHPFCSPAPVVACHSARAGKQPGRAQRVPCPARAALPSAHGARRLPRGLRHRAGFRAAQASAPRRFSRRASVSVEGHARGATRCARDIERCRARHCTVWRPPAVSALSRTPSALTHPLWHATARVRESSPAARSGCHVRLGRRCRRRMCSAAAARVSVPHRLQRRAGFRAARAGRSKYTRAAQQDVRGASNAARRRRCGGVAVWRCGGVAVWRCGGVALWRCGAVAVWRYHGLCATSWLHIRRYGVVPGKSSAGSGMARRIVGGGDTVGP